MLRGFRDAKLQPTHMAMSRDYGFFREAIRQAMGERGYHDNSWLFTVYWVLREISRRNPEDFSISRKELPEVVERIPAPGPLPDPHEILRTAAQANFLQYDEDLVGVKIRTLGRLAVGVRPELA